MAAEMPVSDVLCEAMEYLSKLGSNLRTRSENLKEKRISKEKLKNSHAVQKAASKVLLICELSKKSLDNVETGVRNVLSMLKASQEHISGNDCHKKSGGSNHRHHYFEYQSRKLRIAKKISLKHYTSVKVLAKEMPASMLEKYPVYYDCKLKRLQRRASTKCKPTPETNGFDNDQSSKNSICSDVKELSDDVHVHSGRTSKALEDHCQVKVSNTEQSSLDPMDDHQDSQTASKPTDEKKSESDADVPSHQKELTKNCEEILDCHLDQNHCTKDSSNKSRKLDKARKHRQKNQSTSDKESNTSTIRFADVYSSDSNEDPKKSESQVNDNKDTIFSSDAKNNNDDVELVSDSSNQEPKPKKLKLITSENSTCLLDSDSGANKSKTEKGITDHDSVNKESDNDLPSLKHCEDSQPSSDGESKPLIRCVNLSKLLKPGVLGDNSKLNNTQQSEVKKMSPNKNNKHNIRKGRHHKESELSEKENENKFWAQKRKEVKEFRAKKFTVNVVRLPNLSLKFLLDNNLKKITRQGKIICEVQNEMDTPNSKQMKAAKTALLNDSESDEYIEIPDAMQVKRSLLKDSDSEHNTSDKEQHKEPDKHDGTYIQEVTKDLQSVENRISDSLDNILVEADMEINCSSESTVADNIHSKVCITDEKQADNCDKTPGDNIVKHVGGEDKISLDGQSNGNDLEIPNMINQAVKSSLLNDSSDDEFAAFNNNEQCNISKPNESNDNKEVNQNNSGNEECNIQTNKETPSTSIGLNETKSSHLNSSTDDLFAEFSKPDTETPTKTNEKMKSALLNNSSDDNQHKDEEETPTKVNEKVKCSLLNDSSDIKSDETDNQRDRQKTPKSKIKHARRCREVKKKIQYSSSSDSEQDKPRDECRRKKSYISSSSSSEESRKKIKKKKPLKLDSDSNDTDKNKSIDQIDGAVDEQSNSSVDKMVRSKAKPSGSSSQNSDNQDASDKDIHGLTNLNNLSKSRRRDTSAKSREDDRSHSRSKPTSIIGEDLLKAESSSEASDVEDNEIVQDLPAVTLTGLNGDHMAKDDLLGESDSSVSHNDKEQSEEENVDNSDEEENVKSKRRKAHAISSGSENGSNTRKLKQSNKMSDFEDSEDESSEAGKKIKRKKKASDSDASVDSKEGQKKRRRIKVVNDSDVSGSDTENEGRNKHGRKNIRKVMGKNQLEEATKKAAREEKERIARISERQKLYNNLDFDESGKPDEVVLEKVVLDFDPETKEPLIQVDRGLVKKLKPHQANGIKFMWDACFESVKRIKKDKGSGCILAHCMGLGKTLQVISLTHTLLIHGKLTGVNRVLVVCPLSTVLNWVNEFRMWLKHAETEFEVDVYELSRYKQNSERAFQLQQWFEGGGVCVLGYEMFRNLSADNNKKFKKKMLKSFQESLVEPGPDLVVCDEGHLLKNEKTSLSQSMNKVKTLRRIVLTGTPLQNNLKEYYCMVQFVKPNLLGKYNEYLNRFVNPITNGQYTDSTEHDIRVMKRRSHVLHKMLDGAVQRRDYGVLAPFLPPKHEYVLFITLTDVQVKLYQFYLENYSRRPLPGKSSGFLFPDFQSLQRIWTHPLVLKYNSERYEIMQQKKREREEEDSEGSLVDFIDDDSTPDESSTEESSEDLSDMSDDSRKKTKKKKTSKKGKGKDSKASTRRGTRANPEIEDEDNGGDDVVAEVKYENPTEWWIKLVDEAELEDMRNSHKLILLFDILRQCEAIGDKLLVFSQSLYSLDLIEHFLGKVDEATQEGRIDEKLGGHVGSWSPGVDYFRLDGSTSCENRSIWCKNFNREDNPRARLFLISTRAGGLGINLVAANRVVIFDVSWNPSHDVQSIFRVYRFGQKKPCYVYRFLAMGTMEEKIYERQVTKQAISKRVIDEQQIDRHYAENDLAELYKFEARPVEPRPLPTLPKDRLFAEMLKEHEAQIYKYHEHDSLLENKEEETLSEEERKAAWEDFENEKNKPPPAPFPSAWPMHNGMVPSLLAQQQQQLAYAALAAMLRKDMPNINDNQIRDMLPLIYNSNPGLMQKMGEIYKYAQPGMMNPGMMNPVMNTGSGGVGAGGASGLQYEPPWQRQHQQQQQMRLQQLMQQQNQMGAKFYAGGLGSRDPIAMALQQQRAREMLMGGSGGAGGGGGAGGAGRPRGRPPLQPRHPTTTSQDVVNLDSD